MTVHAQYVVKNEHLRIAMRTRSDADRWNREQLRDLARDFVIDYFQDDRVRAGRFDRLRPMLLGWRNDLKGRARHAPQFIVQHRNARIGRHRDRPVLAVVGHEHAVFLQSFQHGLGRRRDCLLYTSPSPRD